MIFQAIEFAAKAHRGQYRKETAVPYIVHPVKVGEILIRAGCSGAVVAAGILHDTVEDTEVTLEQIAAAFGPEVAGLVEGASEPDKSAPWEARKRHTIAHLRGAPTEVLRVVCADKLDNIRSIREDLDRVGEALWSRFSRPREAQQWYFRSLVEVLRERMTDEPGRALFRQFESAVAAVFGEGEG